MKVKVGVIGVDSGLCWIGDPCYVLHTKEPPKDIGTNWSEFVNRICEKNDNAQFNYDYGHSGLGVCVSTGYGDGLYPVYADIEKGTVKRFWVEFISEEENELD